MTISKYLKHFIATTAIVATNGADALAVTRSRLATAYVYDGFGYFAALERTAQGSLRRPNSARRKARDAAVKCYQTQFDQMRAGAYWPPRDPQPRRKALPTYDRMRPTTDKKQGCDMQNDPTHTRRIDRFVGNCG